MADYERRLRRIEADVRPMKPTWEGMVIALNRGDDALTAYVDERLVRGPKCFDFVLEAFGSG